MTKFKHGDEVFFTCKNNPPSSGRYVIERLVSDDGTEYELASSGEVYIGEVYKLVGKPWLVPATSLQAV